MIAVDTSSLINFLRGATSPDVALVRGALRAQALRLPPPVKTEILSAQANDPGVRAILALAPALPLEEGYWERAGASRRLIGSKGLRARFADTLIAQACIDADVELIAADGDYRHFARWCGLKLAVLA